jgi:putative redox protein
LLWEILVSDWVKLINFVKPHHPNFALQNFNKNMATKITIKNLPLGYQSIVSNGRHAVVSDEPLTGKGTDLGFSPEDLLLAALATCKVNTVRFIARKKGWEIRDVEAQLELAVKRNPDRSLDSGVQVFLKIEGDLTDEQRAELLHEADHCYVHRMITGTWDIAVAQSFDEKRNPENEPSPAN